jgi:HD-like signal output (HDOD) protein
MNSPLPVLDQVIALNRLKDLESLPTLPNIVNRIIETLDNPESRVQDLMELIIVDQSLSLQILRVANSAYYGLTSRVLSLDRAIMIIGFDEIQRITMAASLLSAFKGQSEQMKSLWFHSLETAYVCRFLAEKMHDSNQSEVYTAGLLHDVGKVIIAVCFSQYFHLIQHYVTQLKQDWSSVEQRILGVDHAYMGQCLSTIWGLPPTVRSVIAHHHSILNRLTDSVPEERIVMLTALANLLVNRRKRRVEKLSPIIIPEELLLKLQLTNQDISEVEEDLKKIQSTISSYF